CHSNAWIVRAMSLERQMSNTASPTIQPANARQPALTAAEAAKIVGVAPSTLAKLRLNGNGPIYCKLGRRVVYRRPDLEVWLESRVAHNTSDADERLPKSLTQSVTARLDARSSGSGSL